MDVYGDVVIALNFIMNSLILLLTAYVAGREFSFNGLFGAALLGSFYALGEAAAQLAVFYSVPVKLAVAAIMVYLTFGYKTVKSFGLMTAMFFLVSFIFAGAVMGWAYFLEDKPWGGGGFTFDFIKLATGVLWAALLIFLAGRWLSDRVFRRKNSYLVKIRYQDKEFSGVGFLDTGNALYSPLGRKPVILLNKEACLQILPHDIAVYLQKNRQDDWVDNLSECRNEKWLSSVEIIPYTAISGKNVLLGFRPDEVVIFDRGKSLCFSQVIVAVADSIFGENDACSALLHPALMREKNREDLLQISHSPIPPFGDRRGQDGEMRRETV